MTQHNSSDDTLSRLARIETRLDSLLEYIKNSGEYQQSVIKRNEGNIEYLAKKVEEMDNLKHRAMGAVAALTCLFGVLTWAGIRYSEDVAQTAINDIDFIESVCREVRTEYRVTADTAPNLCKLDRR